MPGFMDYIGPFMLLFVGSFVQTPIVNIGLIGINLGAICELFGIIALFFINGYIPGIKKLNETYQFGIKPFTVQIALIVFQCLYIATIITGAAAQPTGTFAAVIFYCRELFTITIILTYLTILARLLKLRKIMPT